jgi:hypothetical protein
VAGSCEHGNESSGSIKGGNFLTSCVSIGFPRRALFHGISLCTLYEMFVVY